MTRRKLPLEPMDISPFGNLYSIIADDSYEKIIAMPERSEKKVNLIGSIDFLATMSNKINTQYPCKI